MEKDLISVIIPTYNRETLLPKAIRSVLEQTYTNWELIIVDDRSTDHTLEMLKPYLEQDHRIKVITNTHAKGPAGARNCGIEAAKGKYLSFLDSDDQWLANHLSESYEALQLFDASVCFSTWYEKKKDKTVNLLEMNQLAERIDEAAATLHAKVKGDYIRFPKAFFEYTMTYGICCYHMNTLVARRDALERIGLFNEKLRASEDSELIFKLLIHNDFCLIKKPHFIYNEGNDNIYNFMDRSSVDLKLLLSDTETITRINFLTLCKCRMYQNLIKDLKNCDFDTKNSVQLLKGHIAYKLESLSYLNCFVSKGKSALFMLKSCINEFHKENLCFIPKVLFSRSQDKLFQEIKEVNIW